MAVRQTSRARRTDPYRALPSTADEFEVAFGVPRDPARVAEAAVGAPRRQPLADVTARYVTPAVREPCPKKYQQPAVCRPRLFSFSKRKVRILGARGKTRGSRRKTRRIADRNRHSTPTGTSLSGKGRDQGARTGTCERRPREPRRSRAIFPNSKLKKKLPEAVDDSPSPMRARGRPMRDLTPHTSPIHPTQGLSNRVCVIRATDENAAPNGERGATGPQP